ncbi:MAG: hypothetical protein QGG24_08490 [Vicinamibacterales bacterium]|nr:hypothetical protein [Acidobacteriota bacterium]MDP7295345.1 hypothetical protein [Vicinamibacterales bacterium]MDP7471037.1 hypothetical protein [Vicinamibacterales bacterium]MDP7670469.1 hypothetical protein [Vicinamibacterales bacterium]HJO38127.1 hypothetical protein [Vicinamibacterales bacterium]|tara:strand:- start:7710 stop:8648 length:939 start_codon:yes stop_codon:yes gene_type:complete
MEHGTRVATFVISMAVLAGALLRPATLGAQVPQSPSPMVDTTRPHPRIEPPIADGQRESLAVGTLFVPGNFSGQEIVPLIVNFHHAYWLGEHYVSQLVPDAALVMVPLGAGSRIYSDAFADPDVFSTMIDEVELALEWIGGGETTVGKILLSSFSAGYGATRAILRHPEHYARVDGILLADGLHAAYVEGAAPPRPGGESPAVVAEDLEVFARFAADAVAERKLMWVTHSEVFPGTYASTTETADYLLGRLGLARAPGLSEGPVGMQQLSAVEQGSFLLAGFAGNTAPDHLDHQYALGHWLGRLRRWLLRAD